MFTDLINFVILSKIMFTIILSLNYIHTSLTMSYYVYFMQYRQSKFPYSALHTVITIFYSHIKILVYFNKEIKYNSIGSCIYGYTYHQLYKSCISLPLKERQKKSFFHGNVNSFMVTLPVTPLFGRPFSCNPVSIDPHCGYHGVLTFTPQSSIVIE